MFNRLKKIWELSKKPEEVSNDKLREILGLEPLGDGKAEYLGEGTAQEFSEQKEQDKGFKSRPFGL